MVSSRSVKMCYASVTVFSMLTGCCFSFYPVTQAVTSVSERKLERAFIAMSLKVSLIGMQDRMQKRLPSHYTDYSLSSVTSITVTTILHFTPGTSYYYH